MGRVILALNKYLKQAYTRIQKYSDECPSCPPPQRAYPCCSPLPMYYCKPRTKYDVNFIYINDKPPSTAMGDFVDRIAQTVFWTELARGKFYIFFYLI